MRRTSALSLVFAVLLCGTAPVAGALEIDGSFQIGNLGFAPTRASSDATLPGADWLWGGFLSVAEDLASNVQLEAALQRDQISGNTVSALFQYRTEFFHVGMGPFLGLLNSSTVILKSGISTDVGLEIPGKAFVSLRTDSSLGGQPSTEGDYAIEDDILQLGFYAGENAICTLGLNYQQLSSTGAAGQIVDSLTSYSLDVKVFEKNVPFRLDFMAAYQLLLKQYVGGPTHGLGSLIAGAGVDFLVSSNLALTLRFRTSVWSIGSGVLAGQSDVGFTPLLFQASAGFELTLPSAAAPAAAS
jgi:hypothetical protein